MSSIFVIQGRDQGRKFELDDSAARVGRDAKNAIPLNDREISRQHAEIRKLSDDEYELLDLGSSNGSYINEAKIESQRLRNGDRIRVGKTVLIFTSSSSKNLKQSDLVKIIQTPLPESASRIVRSLHADGANTVRPMQIADPAEVSNDSLNLVYQTALAVSQTLDLDQLIEKLIDLILESIGPDRACIMLRDEESKQIQPRMTKNRVGFADDQTLKISRSIVDYVTEKQEGVITSDAINDDRWDSQASILKMGVSEAICVPMQGRYGNEGVIYIDTRTPPGKLAEIKSGSRFTDEHLKLMIAIGHQAALAIEDTNFYSAMIQSERMAAMGQTIAMLSHHIKNILQGINGGSYLVKSGISKSELEVIDTGWKIVEKNQAKISQLVMDMLSFSKDREPDMTLSNINSVIDDVIELMQNRADDQNIELIWTAKPNVPDSQFDSEGMHRAILNVVSNGIDACEKIENAKIQVECCLNSIDQRIEIVINDNAGGIPNENLHKIFGLFESGKGNRGTGLGLPVSKKILVEHGGDIEVKSELGQGSTFLLYFPFQISSDTGMPIGNETIEFTTDKDTQ